MNIKQRLSDESFRQLRQLRDKVGAGPSPQRIRVTEEMTERWVGGEHQANQAERSEHRLRGA